eukprot:7944535-Alexandrium_andersonii.AAC.1
MLRGILEDVQASPELPFLILGDLNATPQRIEPLREALKRGLSIDLLGCPDHTASEEPLKRVRRMEVGTSLVVTS